MTRAVLLDLDDTLVDHPTAARVALLDWARELALTGTHAELTTRWEELSEQGLARYHAGETDFAGQRRGRLRAFAPHLDLTADRC